MSRYLYLLIGVYVQCCEPALVSTRSRILHFRSIQTRTQIQFRIRIHNTAQCRTVGYLGGLQLLLAAAYAAEENRIPILQPQSPEIGLEACINIL
jgi:hypothetical protein